MMDVEFNFCERLRCIAVNRLSLNIALLQMDITIGEPEANFAKLERMLEEAVGHEVKPDVIMFPEMWNTGYALERIDELADEEGRRTERLLSDVSRRHGVNIIGGSIA